ncbi:UDP-N-acetylmuramoyl-tripeptide--D-alanyl-D-alanine ligase [Candidatus Omnitrophota bacterium]
MFGIEEIKKAVGGRLYFSGTPQLEIQGVCIDSRRMKNNRLFVAIKGNRFNGHDFIQAAIRKGAKAVIGSMPSPKCVNRAKTAYIRVADTRRALADLARFHRKRFDIPVIAVTGSNGKTTTKDMLAWILSSRSKVLVNPGTQNNDIGVPLALLQLNSSHEVAVMELGTNHFGEIAYLADIVRPNFGIITNIGPAHLEHFGNLSGVYEEKTSLLRSLRAPGIAILNADEPMLARLRKSRRSFVVTYGINNVSDFRARAVKQATRGGIEFIVNSDYRQRIRLNTPGRANVYNALAAIAVVRMLGWGWQPIRSRLAQFSFPAGRMKLIRRKEVFFIDDTYNSNPASLCEALRVLRESRVQGRKIFIMGDMLELGSSAERFHRNAGIQIAQTCDAFIGVGRLAQIAADWAVRLGLSRECVYSCRDSRRAGDLLFKRIKPQCRDLVLVKGSRLMKMEEVFKTQ